MISFLTLISFAIGYQYTFDLSNINPKTINQILSSFPNDEEIKNLLVIAKNRAISLVCFAGMQEAESDAQPRCFAGMEAAESAAQPRPQHDHPSEFEDSFGIAAPNVDGPASPASSTVLLNTAVKEAAAFVAKRHEIDSALEEINIDDDKIEADYISEGQIAMSYTLNAQRKFLMSYITGYIG